MLIHRTNVLLSEEDNELLTSISNKQNKTKGEILRYALNATFNKKSNGITERQKAFKEIRKITKKFKLKKINYKELVEYGRK